MAAAQTARARSTVAALALFGVLAAAKIVGIASVRPPVTGWSPVAWIWQDLLVAMVFGVLVRLVLPAAVVWISYTIASAYVVLNAGVAVVLSSPLTWTMLRAAGGALSDSIAGSLSMRVIGPMAIVAGTAGGLPWLLRRRGHLRLPVVAVAVGVVAAGPWASARVDTVGLDRNAITALLWRRLPSTVHAAALPPPEWRRSPMPGPPAPGGDLSDYRGAAAHANVVLVVLESAAAQYLRLGAGTQSPTPVLAAFARRSVLFTNAYAVYPESIKELYASLCSRSPAFGEPADRVARGGCVSLAERLHRAGYRTGLFHSGRFDYLGMRDVVSSLRFDTAEDAAAIGGVARSSFGVDEPSTVQRLLGWIDALGPDDRFFVTYLPIAGHHPYVTHSVGPYAGATDFDRYRNALHEADAALGQLLDGLRRRHLDRTTAVIVMGDHGEAFGQHPGNAGHTLFIFDENVRVPLAMSWPGLTRGVTSPAVASAIDLTPTIGDLVGLAPEAGDEGQSLLGGGDRLALFFTDYSLGLVGLRDGCWKDIYEIDSGRSLLFDACGDPGETRDVSAVEPARVSAYRDRLTAWLATRGAAAR